MTKGICDSGNKCKRRNLCSIYSRANNYTDPLSCQFQVILVTRKETGIPVKYSDFSNVFSSDSAAELLQYIGINNHPINLLDNKQLPYGPIYSLGLVELETLKTYIKANLPSGLIRPFKFFVGALKLFV